VINHEVAAVTAACLLIRKEAFEEIAGFDESIAVGFGDVDLCLRAGGRDNGSMFVLTPSWCIHESYTRGTSFKKTPTPKTPRFIDSNGRAVASGGIPITTPACPDEHYLGHQAALNCSYEIRRRIVTGRGNRPRDVSFSPCRPLSDVVDEMIPTIPSPNMSGAAARKGSRPSGGRDGRLVQAVLRFEAGRESPGVGCGIVESRSR